jgi:hypothetical protein
MKLSTVASWHAALNAGDVDRVAGLSAANVAIQGPRGVARGRDVMRAWALSAGVELVPTRWFCGASGEVVVAQHAAWAVADGNRTEPVEVATAFRIESGLVASVARYDRLADALTSVGLGVEDEISAA